MLPLLSLQEEGRERAEREKLRLTFVLFEASRDGGEEIVINDEDLPGFTRELKEFVREEEEDDEKIKLIKANEVYKEEKEIGIEEFESIKDYYFEPDDVKEILKRSELVKKFEELKRERRPAFVVPFVEYSGCDCDSCHI